VIRLAANDADELHAVVTRFGGVMMELEESEAHLVGGPGSSVTVKGWSF